MTRLARRLRSAACFAAGIFAISVGALHCEVSASRGAVPFATTIQLQPVITSGLSSPVFVTSARDGTNRLFIVEQPGRVLVLQPTQTVATVFLDITTSVLFNGERGLLGMAFHPLFKFNGRFFIYYNRQSDGAIVIAEHRISAANPNVADPGENVILTISHSDFPNHNGGMMAFGPDGYLYIGTGDGGSANDPLNNAQNINALLGKFLRIDIDNGNGQTPYSSPQSNPFVGVAGADEIFAYGMRNPWRFSFDRGTGMLYAGDVGQGAWEEVDIITLGGNYGWRVMEGNHCNPNLNGGVCTPIGIAPIDEYGHTAGRCSITGGYVYRGPIATVPTGAYLYADFCTGEIFMRESGTTSLLLDTTLNISSFGEDEAGEIYVVGLGGTIHRIVNPTAPCSFAFSPSNSLVLAPGGMKNVAITAPINCNWSAFSNDTFITITSSNSGAGSGALTYAVAPNPSSKRSGTLTIAGLPYVITQAAKRNPFDFDNDARSDLSTFRPSDRTWRILKSSTGAQPVQQWGFSGDVIVPGDYDGDGSADIAVFRPSNGTWWILRSSDGGTTLKQFALQGDVPVPGDYDGDGKTDIAVFRPSNGTWWILKSTDGTQRVRQWGFSNDLLVPGDYDGDGVADIAVFRPSNGTWWILRSSDGGTTLQQFALQGDVPVPADYDGDGKTDIAIFRPSNGTWWVLKSTDGTQGIRQWGLPGDELVQGDYDGDGVADIAVFRPSDGTWWVLRSSDGGTTLIQFAASGDVPVPSAYVP